MKGDEVVGKIDISSSMMATVVVNTLCNQRCVYCPPMGEAHCGSAGELDVNVMKEALDALFEKGVRIFRITGGEPCMHSDFDGILSVLSDLQKRSAKILLNTNATHVQESYIDHYVGINQVRISLDSLDRVLYKEITGTDLLDRVLNNIRLLVKAGANVELIMVLTKSNFDEVERLVEFCELNSCSLKLNDLEEHEFDKVGYFETESIEGTAKLKDFLNQKYQFEAYYSPGKGGVRMRRYKLNNGKFVTLKDKSDTTVYTVHCMNECDIYPCPEGVFSTFIKPDGTISWCRRGRGPIVNVCKNNNIGIDNLVSDGLMVLPIEAKPRKNNKIIQPIDSDKKSSVIVTDGGMVGYKGVQHVFGRDKR